MPQTVHWLTFKLMQGSTTTHGQVAEHPVLGLAPAAIGAAGAGSTGADNEELAGVTVTGGVTTGVVTTGKGGGKAGW